MLIEGSGGDRTRKRGVKGVSRQEFEDTLDTIEDLIKRMIKTEDQVDRIVARVMGINTYLKRLDEIEARLKRLEEKAKEIKPRS